MNTGDRITGTHGHPDDRDIVELSDAECWAHLRDSRVGRIAWTTTRGPVVVPVNLSVDGRLVRIRTSARSEMVAKVDAERVAVQVDDFDEVRRSGWSVLARGLAEVRYHAADGPDPDTWPTGPRPVLVVVAVDEISGRQVGPAAGQTSRSEEDPGPW